MYEKFPKHETHAPHKQCYLKWKSLQHSILAAGGVDSHVERQILTEIEKNTLLLERLLDVTIHLASRNLAFRGKTLELDNVHNGNFLGTLELLAHYDPILHEHLEKVREKKAASRLTHYLSPETQNEFIKLCGKKVLNSILAEREEAIYYAVICDSTPDISHTEQNVLLLRYVHQDKNSGVWEITERFLQFKDFNKKSGKEISQMILDMLKDSSVPLEDCRGQGYDNGANMSGKVKGVQAQILQQNPVATYSPCASHTLNLVGVHAAQSCPQVSTFFGCINCLYTFFSASPERWAILKDKTGCSLHRLSETRWSARIAAVRVVATHLPSIIEALDSVIANCNLTNEAKYEANSLKDYFSKFDAVLLLTVWVKILQCTENRNIILQAGNISLDVEAANIASLKEEMQALRNEWDSLLGEATLVAQAMETPTQFKGEDKRKKRRKRMYDETEGDTSEENAEQAFKHNIFYVALDSIISDLSARFQTTASVCDTFAAFLKITDMTEDQMKISCQTLIKKYNKDLTAEFEKEMLHLKAIHGDTFPNTNSPLELLNAIYKMQLESIFGEVCIGLRIFCTLPVTVAGGERAFSKLKLVKNYLRSTMSQDRLNSLAILSVESQLAKKLDFKDLISKFAHAKTRQWAFSKN